MFKKQIWVIAIISCTVTILWETVGNTNEINDTPYANTEDSYTMMNFPLNFGVELSCFDMEKTVPFKGNTTYEIIVTNTGNIADNISIFLPPPCDCEWMEYLSTETVELLPNQNITILLTVSTIWDFIPIHLGHWITSITATSQGDPTQSDSITVNTTIVNRTIVFINPSSQNVKRGETFTMNITVNPNEPIAGVQFDLSFDPTFLTCNSVTDGELFQAYDTYFMDGTIDDNNGKITGAAGITIEGNTSLEGTFAIINFTTKNHSGTSPLNLANVEIGTPEGVPLTIKIHNGNVTVVWESWDINQDGRTNILDLIIIGQHWGETGPPCWIPYDVNCDGVINILDMILVGQYWTG